MNYDLDIEGEASRNFRKAVIKALIAGLSNKPPWSDLTKFYSDDPIKKAGWEVASVQERANWMLRRLWTSTEIVPADDCNSLGIPCGSTFATLARALKAELDKFEGDLGTSGSVRR